MTHFEAYFKIFTVPLQAEFYDKKIVKQKCEAAF